MEGWGRGAAGRQELTSLPQGHAVGAWQLRSFVFYPANDAPSTGVAAPQPDPELCLSTESSKGDFLPPPPPGLDFTGPSDL